MSIGHSFALIAFIVLAFTISIVHVSKAQPGIGQSVSSPQTIIISGTHVFLSYSFDICSHIPFAGSCPLAFSVSENYTQPVSVQFQDSTFLQPNSVESTGITITPGTPNLILVFTFSVGSKSYSYSVPLPAVAAPGSFTETIHLSQILANIASIDTGLPLSILGNIASFDFAISAVASIEGDVALSGFTSSQGPMYWNSPIQEFYNSTLTGAQADSTLMLQNLQSKFSVDASLTIGLPLLPPIHLVGPVHYDLISFGSSSSTIAGEWYQVKISSSYSQPTGLGPGWYLAGSTANIALQDQTVTISGTKYDLAGWTGIGAGSYTGTETSLSLVVSAPIQETANWQTVQGASSNPLSGAIGATIGIGVLTIVAVGATAAVLLSRRKRSV